MRERKTFCQLVWYPETHGKEENARDFQAMMQNGMVLWPRGNEEAEWIIRHLDTLGPGYGFCFFDSSGKSIQCVIRLKQLTVRASVYSGKGINADVDKELGPDIVKNIINDSSLHATGVQQVTDLGKEK